MAGKRKVVIPNQLRDDKWCVVQFIDDGILQVKDMTLLSPTDNEERCGSTLVVGDQCSTKWDDGILYDARVLFISEDRDQCGKYITKENDAKTKKKKGNDGSANPPQKSRQRKRKVENASESKGNTSGESLEAAASNEMEDITKNVKKKKQELLSKAKEVKAAQAAAAQKVAASLFNNACESSGMVCGSQETDNPLLSQHTSLPDQTRKQSSRPVLKQHALPNPPAMPNPPSVPNPPSMPTPPSVPNPPSMPNPQSMPNLPSMPNAPSVPNPPSMPNPPYVQIQHAPPVSNPQSMQNQHAPPVPNPPPMPNQYALPNPPSMPNPPTLPNQNTLPNPLSMPNQHALQVPIQHAPPVPNQHAPPLSMPNQNAPFTHFAPPLLAQHSLPLATKSDPHMQFHAESFLPSKLTPSVPFPNQNFLNMDNHQFHYQTPAWSYPLSCMTSSPQPHSFLSSLSDSSDITMLNMETQNIETPTENSMVDVETVSACNSPSLPTNNMSGISCLDCQIKDKEILDLKAELSEMKSSMTEQLPAAPAEPRQRNYKPKTRPDMPLSNYIETKNYSEMPEGFQLLAPGSPIAISSLWLHEAMASIGRYRRKKEKRASRKGEVVREDQATEVLKRLMDGFFEPVDLAMEGGTRAFLENPIFQGLKCYATHVLKMDIPKFNRAWNTKMGSSRLTVNRLNKKRKT